MHSMPFPEPTRALAVVDWTVDAEAVVAALRRHREARARDFALLVPAWLHGLDWVGDPMASVPCAERQLQALVGLCGAVGISIESATVGDPDPVTATVDVLNAWPAREVLLCTRSGHFAVPPVLGAAARIGRATGLRVTRLPVAVPVGLHAGRLHRRSGRCTLASTRTA